MCKLSTERSSSHQGEFANFTDVLSYPKPISENGVPIWFGGESNAALCRVAKYGDGWIGFNLLPDQAGENASKNCSGLIGAVAPRNAAAIFGPHRRRRIFSVPERLRRSLKRPQVESQPRAPTDRKRYFFLATTLVRSEPIDGERISTMSPAFRKRSGAEL
jgi:Luciferase-like monooxygenase